MAAAIADDEKRVIAQQDKRLYPIIKRTSVNEHYDILKLPYGDVIINAHDPLVAGSLQSAMAEIESLSPFARGVVIDVGANVGSHSLNFSKTADQVIAFEAHPSTFYMFCGGLVFNQAHNVLPFHAALGSYNGIVKIPNLDPTLPNTLMGVHVGEGALTVPMRTLDSFEISPAHFMKIDVEGHELEVLRGAIETLTREHLIVFVEIHKPELVEPIKAFMTELEYQEKEYLSQFTREDGEIVHLTTGYIFWKEGRIKWA